MGSSIAPADITGLVLCGGRGTRMGGVDKGLQAHRSQPLALHALQRLQPQVGRAALSANRNLAAYEAFGVPVWTDTVEGYPGPLAGWLAGLRYCETPYLATVPCDSPGFPADLVQRLAAAMAADGTPLAMAATLEGGLPRPQPVFCLLQRSLHDELARALAAGERQVGRWASRQSRTLAVFDDAAAFFNANTPDDMQHLAAG